MRIPDRFRKERDRSFRWWMENERKKGEEYAKAAVLAEYTIPKLLIESYPMLTMKDIYEMSWSDVVIRVELAASKIMNMNDAMRDSSSGFSNVIRNTEVS